MRFTRLRNPYYSFQGANEQKEMQRHDHDQHAVRDVDVEPAVLPPSRPFDCAAFVRSDRIRRMLEAFPEDLRGTTTVVSCAGMGDYGIRELLERGTHVVLTDISFETLRAAKVKWREFPGVRFAVADAEQLPFARGASTYSYAHAGLHHLPQPLLGVVEMYRVASDQAVFLEAQDSFLMWLLVKLGMAEDWESSGNYVYRFSRREIFKLCASMGIPEFAITSFANQYSVALNTRVYPYLSNPIGFGLFRRLYTLLNAVLAPYGNALLVVLRKPAPDGPQLPTSPDGDTPSPRTS